MRQKQIPRVSTAKAEENGGEGEMKPPQTAGFLGEGISGLEEESRAVEDVR